VHIFSLIPSEQQPNPIHHHQRLIFELINFLVKFNIFRSEESSLAGQEGLGGWMSYLSQQATQYLPQQVNDLILREKSTATARLPILGPRTVLAMPKIRVYFFDDI